MKARFKNLAMIFAMLILNSSVALADHPKEGDQTIESLSAIAISNSLELKALDERILSFEEQKRATFGSYAPRLSIEAGPQLSKVAGQDKEGAAVYGKLDWNLFRGGQDQLDSKIASESAEGLMRRRSSIENRIRSDVAEVYYEMQFFAESVALKNEALTLNNEQKKSAVAKNSAGFTSTSDVLEFELREATILSDIVMLDQSLNRLSRRLSTMVGKQVGDPSLRVKGHLERMTPSVDRLNLVENLLLNNELILGAQTEQKIFDLEKRKEQSAYYPRVDLETRYGRLGNAESVNPDKNDLTLLLKVSVPIFSGLETSHRIMSKRAYARATQFDGESEKMHLLEELDGLIETIQSVQKRLDIEEKNLQKSRDYYDATLREYSRGLKNSPDMVTASERVLDAKIRNLEFRRDLSVAVAKISKLTGVTLK